MKQIKQIWPAEAFTGILLGDHLSCNLIKFLITGGRGLRGLRHRTVLLQTSLLLLLLHFTQVDILQPDQIRSHSTLPRFPMARFSLFDRRGSSPATCLRSRGWTSPVRRQGWSSLYSSPLHLMELSSARDTSVIRPAGRNQHSPRY